MSGRDEYADHPDYSDDRRDDYLPADYETDPRAAALPLLGACQASAFLTAFRGTGPPADAPAEAAALARAAVRGLRAP